MGGRSPDGELNFGSSISNPGGTSRSADGRVELRHRSWSDELDATIALLNELGAAWVQIDEPKFKFSIRQNYLPNVRSFYYMRLHGRNAEKWWRHDSADDRYDYLYSAGELKEFSETAGAARQLVKKAYLYTNNHFSAKSVANAAMIKQQLGEPLEGEYSPEFAARVPGDRRRPDHCAVAPPRRYSLTVHLRNRSPRWRRSTTSSPSTM